MLQLIPLPEAWRQALSPQAAVIDQILRFGGGPHALTINSAATTKAAAVAAMVIVLFWSARETLRDGGTRTIVRAVAWTGLAISTIAIILRASRTVRLYGIWRTGFATEPYGPFINRNHMGSWLVMALPLVIGYVFARGDRRSRERSPLAGLDATMIWLVAAAGVILAAAVVSLSRSTAVGVASGGFVAALMTLRRRARSAPWLVAGAGALAVMIVISIPRTVELADRFQDSRTTPTWARPQIWRETLPIVRDFALTGTGLGTYSTAMLVYQRSDRIIFFNQAHNQYLQLAAEGGMLLLVPLIVAAMAFAGAVRASLAADRSPMFWIRTGALAGIVGVLVQSVWETGLRLPANGLLFAVLCAIVIHDHRQEKT